MNTIQIEKKLMAVKLSCSYSFGRVTDKSITNKANDDNHTKALVVKKELLPGDSGKKLKELQKILALFYQYHIKITMSGVNDGERLMPVPFYLDYMQEFSANEAKVRDAFKEFKSDYPRACVQAQGLLNGAYNPADYPDVSNLDQLLNFRVITVPLPVASTLLTELGACIQTDVERYTTDAIKASLSDVNGRMREALERMVRQLSDPKKKVYDSLTENLAELIGLAPSLNVTDDQTTTDLINEIKQKLLRVGPDELRNNPDTRKNTADAAQEILRRMM